MKQNFYTKIFFLLLLFWGVGERVMGQVTLPHYEAFNYTAGTPLQTQVGWTAINTGDNIDVLSGNLSYTGMPAPIGNKIGFAGIGIDAYKSFTNQTSGSVYYSLLLNVKSMAGVTDPNGGYIVGFIDNASTTNYGGTLWTKRVDDNTYNIGIEVRTATGTATTFTTTNYTTNTTYLIVVKYTFVTGTNNDEVRLWVNPAISPTEPTPTLLDTHTGTDLVDIAKFLVRQDSNTETPDLEIDELRIGTSWSDVIPTTPSLSVSPASLSGFSTTVGSASSSQNYTLSGANLTPASGNITVTAPANFEVSTDNSTFSGSVNVPYNSGTLASTTIYVRIAASAPAGPVSGNVSNAGGGATTQNVAVSGNVSAPFSPIYEPFAGTGNLNGQNGWATHNGTVGQVQRIAGNLNYTGLETATGNKIQLLSTQSEDLNKGFSSVTSGNVYASFIIRVSDVSKFQTNTNVGAYFMHFAEEAGATFSTFNYVARVYVRQGSASNTYQLGILTKGGGSPTAADIYGTSPQDLAINTNYFVVIKYNIATQASSIFINPVPGSPEPTPTFTSTFGTSTPTDLESICLRNANTSGVGTGDIEIDELRVGITWAQVTPANTSPVINVNPATLNLFTTNANTASAVQDYIVSGSNLSSNLVITAPAGFEIKQSTSSTYGSSVTLTPVSGNVPNTTINVRLAASNTNAKILIANITNTSGTVSENVAVRGVVNATLANFPDTPKDQLATPQTYTFSAVGLTENVLITNSDNQNFSLSKDGTNFASSISFTPAEVNNNNVTISVRFEPKSDVNGLKPVNLQHSANLLTAIVSTEGRQLAPLSIADELVAQTIVFPNPASKFVQVQTSGVYQVALQDVTGRKIGQFTSNETLNVENLPNGLYFLQFSNENVRFVKRLVLQK